MLTYGRTTELPQTIMPSPPVVGASIKITDRKLSNKAKAIAGDSYVARLTGKPGQSRFTIIGSGS